MHTPTAYALITHSAVAGVPVVHRQLTRHQFVTPSSRHSHTPSLRPRNLRAFGLIHTIIAALSRALNTPSKSTRFRAHSHHHRGTLTRPDIQNPPRSQQLKAHTCLTTTHAPSPQRDARTLTFEPFVRAQLTLPSPSWPPHS